MARNVANNLRWQRERRKKNPEWSKEKNRKETLRCRQVSRIIVKEAKNRPCMDCNISYPYYVMDFDHVRGEKLFTIAGRAYSARKLLAEIEKCDVVCSNCHRTRTFKRKDYINSNNSPLSYD